MSLDQWAAARGFIGKSVDAVHHPPHYTGHPTGIECIQIAEHLNFCLGSAIKYIWRADSKGKPIEDLKKARWYIDREIRRREALQLEANSNGTVKPKVSITSGRL